VPFLIAYGVLLGLLANLRVTNVAIFPALLIYWLRPFDGPISPRVLAKEFVLTRALIVPAVFCALMLVSVLFGGWFGQTSPDPGLGDYAANLFFYTFAVLHGFAGVLLLPLIVIGVVRLFRTQPSLTVAMCYVLVAWPLIFSVFGFTDARHVLPALFLTLVLVALGASSIWTGGVPARFQARAVKVYAPGAAVFFIIVFMAYASAAIIGDWSSVAANSDEGLFREIKPQLAQIEDESLLVSNMALGLDDLGDRVVQVDLFKQWHQEGTDPASVGAIVDKVAGALANGRHVYYLYTRLEDEDVLDGGRQLQFRKFYEGIEDRFALREVYRTTNYSLGRGSWVLYEVSDSASVSR
jgi:hypothetical protein